MAIFGRAIIIRRDQPGGAVTANLQAEFPAQLDRLTNQGRQQGGFGDQRLDLRGIGVLFEHLLEHAIKTRHAPANIRAVKLKWQDGVVPGELRADDHRVS